MADSVPSFKVDEATDGTTTQSTNHRQPPTERDGLRQRADSQRNNTTFGHRRKHSPSLQWHSKWTQDSWRQGRVLVIDYVSREHTTEGRRKVVTQEFDDIDGLRKFYANADLAQQAALRVIHVQNAPWATRYLLRKFNIDANDDLVGTGFGKWATYDRPQSRRGKPILNGKTFRAQRDPWRGISRASFGCDYLEPYARGTVKMSKPGTKMMDLNNYDNNDMPCYTSDVYVQRLSVYVQLSDGAPGQAVDPDIPNPYDEEAYEAYQRLKKHYGNVDANEQRDKYIPKLRSLDNGSTIILFENSHSGSVKDTLIGARQELESKWRRLTFYLTRRSETLDNDNSLTTACMDLILSDIFRALSASWARFFAACEAHVGILEDKIYENPADESRAPELWQNSALWLKVERLLYIHVDMARDVRAQLRVLAGGDPKDDVQWLCTAPEELTKYAEQWERDIMIPTTALSDLMYKSVGIRDARHSLELGLSMWRLSWITFIFLPLTFVVGFFGMNVDTFEDMPSVNYFFAASLPLLALVLLLWYTTKHALSPQRQNPLRRGVYEALYLDLATSHPSLWTRHGPRADLVPTGAWAKLKWRLVTRWFGSDKIILHDDDAGTDSFGAWSRIKRALARRWLAQLQNAPLSALPVTADPNALGIALDDEYDTDVPPKYLGAVRELLTIATPVALAEIEPTAASRLQMRIPAARLRSLSPPGSEATKRWSGGSAGRLSGSEGRNSGVMVEEKGASEDERSGDDSTAR